MKKFLSVLIFLFLFFSLFAASSKKYESASEYAKTALYCLKKVEQLRYFGLISNKFMQDYEEILGNLLDECRHNLQGNEVPLQSA